MRLSFLTITAAIIISSTQAQAALAPNYQRAKEMTAIIEAVATEIPTHPITKIIYQKPDQYQVVAGSCSVRAKIVTLPTRDKMVGARQFEVQLSKPRCKNK
ncbi:hypothetical protein ACLBWZ_14770 [Brucellaceae bacterium C25G]